MNAKPTLERPWLTPLLGWTALIVSLAGVVLTFLAPPDVNQGYLTRILPPHVTSAWVAYLGFFMTSVYSLVYLVTRNTKFDRLAASSAELGVVLIAFALISGSLWGRVTWGTFWEWGDARIVTTLLMMMVYLGYLMVRGLIEDPARRARVAAALGAVAAVAVPINYMSVYWWRTLHQTPTFSLVQKKSYLSGNPQLALALIVMVIGFTMMYVYMLRFRAQIAAKVARLEAQDLELELNARNGFRIGEVAR
jgi:heme exporter protein C